MISRCSAPQVVIGQQLMGFADGLTIRSCRARPHTFFVGPGLESAVSDISTLAKDFIDLIDHAYERQI